MRKEDDNRLISTCLCAFNILAVLQNGLMVMSWLTQDVPDIDKPISKTRARQKPFAVSIEINIFKMLTVNPPKHTNLNSKVLSSPNNFFMPYFFGESFNLFRKSTILLLCNLFFFPFFLIQKSYMNKCPCNRFSQCPLGFAHHCMKTLRGNGLTNSNSDLCCLHK